MGLREARADGIKCYRDNSERKRLTYEIPCARCGEIVIFHAYSRSKVYLCKDCRKGVNKIEREAQKVDLPEGVTKYDIRFINACSEIEAQVKNFGAYKDAIKIASQKKEKYASIPEAMVAIELIRLGHKIIPQQKIDNYHVDFAVPDIKAVIEVDGETYHRNEDREAKRELRIQYAFGLDWKIIHMPAELIRKQIQATQRFIDKAIEIKNRQ